jgi:hypothetical protein
MVMSATRMHRLCKLDAQYLQKKNGQVTVKRSK